MGHFLRNLTIILLAGTVLGGCTLLDKKNVSGLQVLTGEAAPSSLFLNDQYLDKTPYVNQNIQPGIYTLRIEPDDQTLVAYETQVVLRKNTLTVVNWQPGKRAETSGGVIYELERIGGKKGQLSFITIPDRAIVQLDNQPQEFSPLVIKDLEPGQHQFEITLPSYQTQEHALHVPAGFEVTVTAKLAKFSPEQDLPAPETKTATASGTVTILPTNFFQDGQEVLRVRSASSSAAAELGFAPVGQTYPFLDISTADWVKLEFEQQPGWVSRQFVEINE